MGPALAHVGLWWRISPVVDLPADDAVHVPNFLHHLSLGPEIVGRRVASLGPGGCRKSRFLGRGKGKRGGYRTVHYNGPDDVPILLLVVLDKGDRDNLSHEERNDLRKLVQTYAAEYRAGVAAKVTQLQEGA